MPYEKNPTIGAADRRVAIPEAYQPNPEEIEALNVVSDRWKPHNASRAQLERTWQHNIAFYLGYQWHLWDNTRWTLINRPNNGRWRVRETRNYIASHVQRQIANLTGYTPKWVGRPHTQDIEDEQAARVSSKVIEGYWNDLQMELLIQELALWGCVMGTGVLKTQWNPYGGKSFEGPAVDERGEILVNEDGYPYPAVYYEGDVETTCPSPFTIHVDPLVTNEDELEWVLEVYRRPLTWIDRNFPERAMFVTNTGGEDDPYRRMRSTLNVAGTGVFGTTSDTETGKDWATIKEYWEKPSPMYPRGRLIITAENVVLHVSDNPHPDRGLPYRFFRKDLIPGSFWGRTEVEDMVTPQKNYNRLVSKRLEHAYLIGTGSKVLWPRAGGQPQSAWTDQIGEIVKYNGPNAPQYLMPPPLPPETEQEMARFRADFDVFSATYGPEKGQNTGKLSGKAIELLSENGFRMKQPQLQRMRRTLEGWGQDVVLLLQEHADMQRTVKLQGKNNQTDIVSFKGADFRGNTDVIIEISSMVPKSRAMALDQIVQLTGAGLINPQDPMDKARAFKAIDWETDDPVVWDKNQDRRMAQLEDKLMSKGTPVEPAKPWEDQDIHVTQHTSFMNSDEFKALPDQFKQLFIEHYNSHLELAMPQPGVTLPPDQQAALAGQGQQPTESPAPPGGET